ncbi:MAG: hypothetical protein IPN69_16445 [Acidobacteria bacterium]|nr:hypothetical protein [Acidobacteriota bacterium]
MPIHESGDNKLVELICNIVRRPSMYVGNCEFVDVAGFIEGFASASAKDYEELREFNRWLAVRLDFPRNWGWKDGMKEVYPNSEDALRELGVLFHEFKQSRSANESVQD